MSAIGPKRTSELLPITPFKTSDLAGTMLDPDCRGAAMRRREFISLLSGAMAGWPLAARFRRGSLSRYDAYLSLGEGDAAARVH